MTPTGPPGLLDQFRVLDLTDAKGQLAGKILGDMGADVVKIEPPKGDPARNIPPFYGDDPNSEKSLYWWAYNTSKRGITLDLATADGQDLFKRLVREFDLVLESFAPGYLAGLGLGYDDLAQVKQDVIVVSLTPFGQTGPYSDFKVTDFITVAMSGNMFLTGDADRPPVACQMPTTYFHACAETANAALMALWYRDLHGEGQHVDVSIHEAMQFISYNGPTQFYLKGVKSKRTGARYAVEGPKGRTYQREIWPCKDGFVSFGLRGGPARIPGFQRLVQWMTEEGFGDDFLDGIDWPDYNNTAFDQDEVDRLVAPIERFFLSKTAMELYEAAVERVLMIAPVYNPAQQLADRHLKAREFFTELDHPELGRTVVYPGPFVKSDDGLVRLRRRAPLIGEHNVEVLEGELGLSRDQLVSLKEAGVI
ncbi:MAG: CoA transferase [Chloroflexi bacterium]|nr:CoA transferase [Chloroflexota bacterium]